MSVIRVVLMIVAVSMVSGCALLDSGLHNNPQRTGRSTSLVEYLYPDGEIPPEEDSAAPHLRLPLRVGLAFVPARVHSRVGPTAAERTRLLEDVRSQFVGLDYVEDIVVIPETYLGAAGNSAGMQQVARTFGVDVMALVSYDQVTHTQQNEQALMYWTLVGAYIFEGTDHETRTFIDLAVVDVATRQLLLRAPGYNERKGDVTLARENESLRRNSREAMKSASEEMQRNLAVELARFEQRMRNQPDDIQVSWREGSGGGSAGLPMLALMGALLLGRRLRAGQSAGASR